MSEKLSDLMEEFEVTKKTWSNEGSRGVQNLCKLVHAIGYNDEMRRFPEYGNASLGDLIVFLEDNPACIVAIKEWIAEQNFIEWRESVRVN